MYTVQKCDRPNHSLQSTQALDVLTGRANEVANVRLGVAVGIATSFVDCGPMVEQMSAFISENSSVSEVQFCINVISIYPVVEEVIFRFGIQECLLTHGIKGVVKKIAPGTETALDSKVAIAARVIFTSACFAACHTTSDSVISAFLGGICLGFLKESQGGLTGVIAAHIINNSIAMIMYIYKYKI